MNNSVIARIFLLLGTFAAIGFVSRSVQSYGPGLKKWEHCLQNALSRSSYDRMIGLMRYEYRGKVRTELEKSRLIDEMFADDAHTLVYLDNDCSIPAMTTWGEQRKRNKLSGLVARADIESSITVGQTDVIDLGWRFGTAIYHSVAIADDKDGKIIYDNIGTYAISKRVSVERLDSYEVETVPDASGGHHTVRTIRREVRIDTVSY